MIRIVTFNIATNGSGAYDSSSDGGVTGQPSSIGASQLLGVRWRDGDLADGVDAVLSQVQGDSTITVATLTDANNDAMYYPHALTSTAGGVAATDNFCPQIIEGTLKLVVSDGGASKSGQCFVYLTDME